MGSFRKKKNILSVLSVGLLLVFLPSAAFPEERPPPRLKQALRVPVQENLDRLLEEEDTDRVLDTLRSTTASGIIGGLLVALIQGALGGIMFAIAGIQSPAVWAMVMAGFSLLPFGGTALVWVPAGVYLLFTGEMGGGWFLLIFGTVIVGSADNLLRPWIMTKTGAEDIHPMLLFFAILSGIGLFGVSGIVFGPLLLALLTTMVSIYREHWRSGAHPREESAGGPAEA